MENNKFTPIAMKCSEAQFKEVEPILKNKGLEIVDIGDFIKCQYLTNNYGGAINSITNTWGQNKNNLERKVYEEYDKETFLKACGIEIEEEIKKECEITKYIGRKVKGFKFKGNNDIAFTQSMITNVGEIGEIVSFDDCSFKIEFENDVWYYPIKETLEHLIEEETIFTCKDLSEGRVACVNDGTVEELRKVLKYCFPNDSYTPVCSHALYAQRKGSKKEWCGYSLEEIKEMNLPTQSVKVFLKEIELEEKEFLEKVKMQDTTILGYDPDNVEKPPLKKFINLSSKETSKKETVFTHVNMGGDWFGINSNLYKEQIKKIFYHGELKDNRGSLFVAELNDGQLVILKGIKGDEFNDL